jgi:hypothetical protein
MTGNPDVTRVSRVDVVIHISGFVRLESTGREWYLAIPSPLDPRHARTATAHISHAFHSVHPDACGIWLIAP